MKDRVALVRNVALVAVASYIEAVVGLLAGVVTARALGPMEYGHYAFAVWLSGALIMTSNNALTTSSIKFLAEVRGAEQHDLANALMHRLIRIQTISSALVVTGFCVYALVRPFVEWEPSYNLVLVLIMVAVWARAGFWMRGAVAKGYEQFKPENLSLAVTALLNMVLVVTLSVAGGTFVQFVAVYALLGLVSNLLVRLVSRRAGLKAVPGPLPEELKRRLRRHLLQTGVLILLVMLTSRAVEMTLLKAYTSSEIVGYFAIAATLMRGAIDLLSGGMSSVLLPAMSRHYGSGGKAPLSKMLAESTRLYWFIGLIIAGLGLTVAEGLVHLLYGSRYDGAIAPVQAMLILGGLIVANGAAHAVLTASDRQLDRIWAALAGFCINLSAGWLLIPRYGLDGAIASYAITQLSVTVLIWSYARRRIDFVLAKGPMLRLFAAALVATACGWFAADALHVKLAFVGGGTVFLAIYLGLSVVLRTWRASDYDVFAMLLEKMGSPGRAAARRAIALKPRFGLPDPS